MSEAPILDTKTVQNLRELAGDDAEFLPQMVNLFLKNCGEKLPALSAALQAAPRLKEAASLCHQLKASAGSLGALKLSEVFTKLELAALEGNLAAAVKLETEVRLLYPAVEAALKAL